jgi:hypothetical protein
LTWRLDDSTLPGVGAPEILKAAIRRQRFDIIRLLLQAGMFDGSYAILIPLSCNMYKPWNNNCYSNRILTILIRNSFGRSLDTLLGHPLNKTPRWDDANIKAMADPLMITRLNANANANYNEWSLEAETRIKDEVIRRIGPSLSSLTAADDYKSDYHQKRRSHERHVRNLFRTWILRTLLIDGYEQYGTSLRCRLVASDRNASYGDPLIMNERDLLQQQFGLVVQIGENDLALMSDEYYHHPIMSNEYRHRLMNQRLYRMERDCEVRHPWSNIRTLIREAKSIISTWSSSSLPTRKGDTSLLSSSSLFRLSHGDWNHIQRPEFDFQMREIPGQPHLRPTEEIEVNPTTSQTPGHIDEEGPFGVGINERRSHIPLYWVTQAQMQPLPAFPVSFSTEILIQALAVGMYIIYCIFFWRKGGYKVADG